MPALPSPDAVNNGLNKLHHVAIEDEPCVFTTARWDPLLLESEQNTAASCNRPCPFYLFEHHYTRLQVAKWGATCYSDADAGKNRGPSVILQGLSHAVQHWHANHPDHRPEALRVKLRCFPSGRMSSEVMPIPRIPLERLFPTKLSRDPAQVDWTIVLDVQTTEPSEYTMYKTHDRQVYARARDAVNIKSLGETKEVILYTEQKLLLDCSLSTPYFFREGRWITPASSCGGQQGATRRWALENGLAVEGVTTVDTLRHGEIMWLSNAARGYFPARFVSTQNETQTP